MCERVLHGHRGTIEKFIGDAVVCVFGTPVAREDDAIRGCRAALGLVAGVETLNEDLERDWGVRLKVRIGVNTGPVVAGELAHGRRSRLRRRREHGCPARAGGRRGRSPDRSDNTGAARRERRLHASRAADAEGQGRNGACLATDRGRAGDDGVHGRRGDDRTAHRARRRARAARGLACGAEARPAGRDVSPPGSRRRGQVATAQRGRRRVPRTDPPEPLSTLRRRQHLRAAGRVDRGPR